MLHDLNIVSFYKQYDISLLTDSQIMVFTVTQDYYTVDIFQKVVFPLA